MAGHAAPPGGDPARVAGHDSPVSQPPVELAFEGVRPLPAPDGDGEQGVDGAVGAESRVLLLRRPLVLGVSVAAQSAGVPAVQLLQPCQNCQ